MRGGNKTMVKGKVAIVTGGGNGIGKEIALGLAREGAHVVIADIDETASAETLAEIEIINQGESLFVKTDLASVPDIDNLVRKTQDSFNGKIDILVNAAGICKEVGLFEIDEKHWDLTLDINLKGSFFCAQKVAAIMVKQKEGKIINIASTSSFIPSTRCMVPYDVSKAGVKLMTKCLAELLGPDNVTVNAIAPATTMTSMVTKIFGEDHFKGEWVSTRYPLGRVAYPSDHLKAVLFLCSEDAGYMNGHTLLVDGGFLLAYRR
jgi:NAD(P)-dependent dehydrogenase (short-subunit alcohol dehydrogenase family)